MHLLAKVPCAQVALRWDRELAGGAEARARQLRGALAEAFGADDLFHQHDAHQRDSLWEIKAKQCVNACTGVENGF